MPTDLEEELGLRLPRYKPPPKFKSEKGSDKMYSMTNLGFRENDIVDRYEKILGPLTLFAPYSHEEEPPPEMVELDRPITPINDEVKYPPQTYNKLVKLVRRRICAKPERPHLTVEDQQALAAIIMGEVNGIWQDLMSQVDDPFLSPELNRELQRRITVHIVTVCEKLFKHYLDKSQVLNKRGVFSGPANMSRLKAQLALDASKFLNVLIIRRHIVSDLRVQDTEEEGSEEFYLPSKETSKQDKTPLLSYKGLIAASRPKSKIKKRKRTFAEEEIKEIERNMPGLDISKLSEILADLPQERPDTDISESVVSFGKTVSMGQKEKRKISHDLTKEKVILKKSNSVPDLQDYETLADELGLEEKDRQSVNSYLGHDAVSPSRTLDQTADGKSDHLEPGTRAFLAHDLIQLVTRTNDDEIAGMDGDDDMPPLLQAITHANQSDDHVKNRKRMLKELEEKEKKRKEDEKVTIQPPTHPQPATVATRLPNKMTVRTSDIRVSDRVCLSDITLQKHSTVYNDLVDEIDAETLKKLDSNLFLGDEITEVYTEIMKTVPKDHMTFENDSLIEPAATHVNLGQALASSSLIQKKSDRIINSKLHRSRQPPWGDHDIKEWAKTPLSPPKDFKGQNHFDPMMPTQESGSVTNVPGASVMPTMMVDIASRQYASWLNWWKNTINSDDYMKYLSSQESDYLGLLFHFYDSDDDGDDDENRTPSRITLHTQKLAEQKEREQRVEELKTQKTEYKEGFWNVNSVLLGGLGKDPVLEESKEDIDEKLTARTEDTSQSQASSKARTLASRASSRSAPLLETGEQVTSQASISGERGPSRHTQTTQTANRASSKAVSEKPVPELTLQDRLEQVWTHLLMPDNQKLDMAIKYSSDDHHDKLEEAVKRWEKATVLVLQREALVAKLEKFERLASDPNRFFEKGYRGSSVARLEEAKARSYYYKKIDEIDVKVSREIEQVKKDLQDTITFQGRPYADKIHWDRTEMLYWLQEERKRRAIEHEIRIKHIPLSLAQLEPISPQVPGY